MLFSEHYSQLRALRTSVARERPGEVSEYTLQCVWYDQLFSTDTFETLQGHRLKILSPGWWNHAEGPDFKGAQLEFNGALHNGDVEIHLDRQGWRAHGHHLDSRYDDVILHVFLAGTASTMPAVTSHGRQIAGLKVADCIDTDLDAFAQMIAAEDYTHIAPQTCGRCTDLIPRRGTQPIERFIEMAGEWRMLNKARALREQMERVGADHISLRPEHEQDHVQHHSGGHPALRTRRLGLDMEHEGSWASNFRLCRLFDH